ncbi:transcriptional regulator, TetR family [Candidatus Pantoea floridensis]|uniref:Transcriptional regulator, TetR family n=1 Tax=Candidatus Pantoea floridensis TaxID=1938870 RepID=A0A286BYD3_9GAMM|nr:TetR family transcriptional regulator [Enterobacteriaceae bacterium JKS000233]SOD39149.1 transcriptional regulator, TetR family [Pantoea floridensis]
MPKTLTTEAKSRERGRPREFDIDQALDKAMIVFRQKGFHAASMHDLGDAMGLTAGSIYKAFKDKRSLFLNVFERYLSVRNADLRQRLSRVTTGREKLAELLQFYLDSARAVEGRTGCLVVGSAIELQVLDDDLSQLVSEAVMRNKNFLASLLRLGQEDGSVSQKLDTDTAAGLILCIAFGMRVVGKIADVKDEPETIKLVMKLLD